MTRRNLPARTVALALALTFFLAPPVLAEGPDRPAHDVASAVLSWIIDVGEVIGLTTRAEAGVPSEKPGNDEAPPPSGEPTSDGIATSDSGGDADTEFGAVIDPQG